MLAGRSAHVQELACTFPYVEYGTTREMRRCLGGDADLPGVPYS